MLTTVALVAALSMAPGQTNSLTLTNMRTTHGILGPTRMDHKILPGDSFCLSFDIQGIKVNEEGKALYSIALEVTNSQGRVIYKQEPKNLEAFLALGGTSLPAFAKLDVGLDEKPGKYNIKVTVTDRAAQVSQTFSQDVEVLPKAFGLVLLRTTGDIQANVLAPSVGVAGQSIFVNMGAVGFVRSATTKQPHVVVAMQVLDENKKPTLLKPFSGEVKEEVPEKNQIVPLQFLLPLNRAGKFTIVVVAIDRVANKNAELSFPFSVIDAR